MKKILYFVAIVTMAISGLFVVFGVVLFFLDTPSNRGTNVEIAAAAVSIFMVAGGLSLLIEISRRIEILQSQNAAKEIGTEASALNGASAAAAPHSVLPRA